MGREVKYGKTKIFLAGCLIFLLISLSHSQSQAAQLSTQPVKILFIPSYNFDYMAVKWFMQGVSSRFAEENSVRATYSVENLQFAAKPGNIEYMERMAESLQLKYAKEKPDLIIAQYKPALRFLQQYGRRIFGDTPVVFAGFTVEGFDLDLPLHFTGVTTFFNPAPNIDLIINNHPTVKKLYIVAGVGSTEDEVLASMLLQAPRYKGRLELIPLERRSLQETLRRLGQLQSDAAILYLSMQLDADGKIMAPAAVAKEIARVAKVPVYGMLDSYAGSGITGGFLMNHERLGRRAAEIVIRILQGKKPQDIPVISEPIGAYTFDWRQLQRWGVDEAGLPPGSSIEFKPFSAWELYKKQIVAGIGLIILLICLVIGLLVNRSLRKRAEAVLRDSEEKYRTLVEKSTEGIIIAQDGVCVFANRRIAELFGMQDLEGKPFIDFIWFEDRELVLTNYHKRIAGENVSEAYEIRIIGAGGRPVWMGLSAAVIRWKERPATLCMLTDISERMRHTDELRRDALMAARIQSALLPVPEPSDYVEIATIYEPVGYVGGDLYFMDWRYGGSLLRGFLIDAAGHGLGTALHTASLHVMLREFNECDLPLSEAMRWLNRRTIEYFDEETIAGALGFEIDLQTRQLRWVCAGIPSIWIDTKNHQGIVKCSGMCLGIRSEEMFDTHTLPIDAGDSLYFMTDGLARLFAEIATPPVDNYQAMRGLLRELAESDGRQDDATAVSIHVRSLPQSPVRRDGWPRILRINGYGDYQRMKVEVADILGEVTGIPHSLMEVAVHEALVNAMECRDGAPRQHKARIRFNKVGNRFIVRVKTSRMGFAGNAVLRRLRSHPEEMFSFGEDAAMGRGIPMMLSMSHRMMYNNEGNEVLLAWKLKTAEPLKADEDVATDR